MVGLQLVLLEDLVIDDPVVMDYAAVLALPSQHSYQTLFFHLFLDLCLFGFPQESMQTGVLADSRLFLGAVELVLGHGRLERVTSWLLLLHLALENADFVLQSVVDLLFFANV